MRELLESLRDTALKRGASFMDVRAVESEGTNIQLQDGKADQVSRYRTKGLGIRVLSEGAWGFASVEGYERGAAMEAIEMAAAMASASKERLGEGGVLAENEAVDAVVPAACAKDPRQVPLADKMKLLAHCEQAAIAAGAGKLVNTIVSYGDIRDRMILCNTRGTFLDMESVRVRMGCHMTAQDGDLRQRGYGQRSRLGGYEFIEQLAPEELPVKAAQRAVALLKARRAPAGRFTVVFDPSITGLLTHEALGHNAEADLVLSGQSILDGKLGQKIAADCITIVDDATIPAAWGSYAYDSEGTPGQRRVLIENGVLKGFMHNLTTAARMGVAPNGSGRAQGYGNLPIVRMSNTMILPGTMPFEELIKDIDEGVYLKSGQWGYVFCERGQYTCSAGEGYLIRNGQVTEHLRDVCISGVTLETLMKADGISNAFEIEMGGMCGKNGQSMYVSGGGPHVRVRDVVVGGQE